MFDVLLHILENHTRYTSSQELTTLRNHLVIDGFEDDAISDAFTYLLNLTETTDSSIDIHHPNSTRFYTARERQHVGEEGIQFIQFLERNHVLTPTMREAFLSECYHLPNHLLTIDNIKIMVLIILWRHDEQIFPLLVDEIIHGMDHLKTLH